MNLKSTVLTELLKICEDSNQFIFHNDLVKQVSSQFGFGNPFDVTKLDHSSKLPQVMIEKDYFLIHLGKGQHQFVKGITNGFHKFEEIEEKDIQKWPYKKSLLNEYDTSESNILSLGFNQKIIQDFLYEDITVNPKVYMARRTKSSINYYIGEENIKAINVQMEIDLTMELNKVVTIFEGKNNFPKDFAIYQLFHPFFYYKKIKTENHLHIEKITCCYLLRKKVEGKSIIRIYNYTFEDENNAASIKLLKAKQYNLVHR